MKLTFSASEVERALVYYTQTKMHTTDPAGFRFDVHIAWRGKWATVEVTRKRPFSLREPT